MFRRVPMYVAADLDELERLVATTSKPIVLIFDADNTLVPQGVAVDEFQQGVKAAIDRFEAHPAVARVIVLTNGPERRVPEMIHRGNKPFTTRARLGLTAAHPDVWVVGDQILTDGVLAWRLGAPFILLALDTVMEAPRQAGMRRIGDVVARLLFRS